MKARDTLGEWPSFLLVMVLAPVIMVVVPILVIVGSIAKLVIDFRDR